MAQENTIIRVYCRIVSLAGAFERETHVSHLLQTQFMAAYTSQPSNQVIRLALLRYIMTEKQIGSKFERKGEDSITGDSIVNTVAENKEEEEAKLVENSESNMF